MRFFPDRDPHQPSLTLSFVIVRSQDGWWRAASVLVIGGVPRSGEVPKVGTRRIWVLLPVPSGMGFVGMPFFHR